MATDDPFVVSLADALCLLVDYVSERPSTATEDDDVRALEAVAHVLKSTDQAGQLAMLLGEHRATALGLGDTRS